MGQPVLPELPRRVPYRTWPGALIVLAIIAGYVGVLVFVDARTPTPLTPVAVGRAVQVGPAVSYVPQDGWYTDADPPGPETSYLYGAGGSGFSVTVREWQGTLDEQVEREKATSEAFGDAQLIGDDATFAAAGGLSGATFAYFVDQTQGRAWISVDDTADRAVVIFGYAPATSFQQALPDFQDMIDSVRTERS